MREIYEDTIIKYTLNIPIQLYGQIAQVTQKRTKYGGRKSTFIREAIDEKLARLYGAQDRPPISRTELLKLEQGQVYEPPRRYSGFISGLLWTWYRNKYLDKTRLS